MAGGDGNRDGSSVGKDMWRIMPSKLGALKQGPRYTGRRAGSYSSRPYVIDLGQVGGQRQVGVGVEQQAALLQGPDDQP